MSDRHPGRLRSWAIPNPSWNHSEPRSFLDSHRSCGGRMLRAVTQALKIVTIVVASLLVVGGGARAFEYYRDQANTKARFGQPVVVTIKKGDDSGAVADKLHEVKLINSKIYFETLVRFSGKEIKPASYSLNI